MNEKAPETDEGLNLERKKLPPSEKSKALLLLFASYILVWADLFLPQPPIAAFSVLWFAFAAAKNCARIVIVFFIMKKIGLIRAAPTLPTKKDIVNGLTVATSAGLLALGIAGIAYILGAANPLLASLPMPAASASLYFSMAFSSLAIGYAEELFFRIFAPRLFENAGLSSLLALFISALIFGLSHASQGLFGIIVSTLIALLFSYFRLRGRNLHALALGHAIYDFVILAALV
jgi:membrane protease YdiL (CAAX protease family)